MCVQLKRDNICVDFDVEILPPKNDKSVQSARETCKNFIPVNVVTLFGFDANSFVSGSF